MRNTKNHWVKKQYASYEFFWLKTYSARECSQFIKKITRPCKTATINFRIFMHTHPYTSSNLMAISVY